ncbi:helix-turn-helix domain-containing protein [Marinomonas sp. TW1]|uniref:helix-turn-helix domain-containing protein n=1 Tax=Marinomonas sp. TW1 TaxID=1561203 RepID=UPI0007AFD189|nr:helix-turn-helix transcriptional regulator [Marinomonas sp. TW1]KZN14533.1 XRE family transcriptional regulator [Marinomonas sp. TW1]
MKIGQVIKVLRLQRKMTQEQIALEADMATSNVSRIEKGLRQPSQKVLWKLAKALNTTPSVIYAASEQPDGNILEFLEQVKHDGKEDSSLKKNRRVGSSIISKDAQLLLKLYSELSPKNKSLLLEQLKTLHKWQEKPI